jgi:hypothetical protein
MTAMRTQTCPTPPGMDPHSAVSMVRRANNFDYLAAHELLLNRAFSSWGVVLRAPFRCGGGDAIGSPFGDDPHMSRAAFNRLFGTEFTGAINGYFSCLLPHHADSTPDCEDSIHTDVIIRVNDDRLPRNMDPRIIDGGVHGPALVVPRATWNARERLDLVVTLLADADDAVVEDPMDPMDRDIEAFEIAYLDLKERLDNGYLEDVEVTIEDLFPLPLPAIPV